MKQTGKFRDELKAHQDKVKKELQGHLHGVAEADRGSFCSSRGHRPSRRHAWAVLEIRQSGGEKWLDSELGRAFPDAGALIQNMQLDVRYKDMTFEELNREDFLWAVKAAFPEIDWEKAYEEFRAAGEKEG